MKIMKVTLTLDIELDIPHCKKCIFLESDYGYNCPLAKHNWGTQGGYTDIMDAVWNEPPEDKRPNWCPLGKDVDDKLAYRLKDIIAYMNGTWGKGSVKSVEIIESKWRREKNYNR